MEGKKKRAVAPAVLAVIAGAVLITQVRMPHGENLYVSAKALDDMMVLVESEKENIRRTELQLEDEKKKLEEFKELAAESETEELLQNGREELAYYKMVSGQTAVRGEGVEVTIADSKRELLFGEDINSLLVHDIDVLTILNDLFTAGAEAAAINGHRIVDMSAITCSGYTIRINGIFTAGPFVIEAIGDPGRLYAAMMSPGSYGKEYLEPQVNFKVETKDDITLPAYTKLPVYQYMTITKEGETN